METTSKQVTLRILKPDAGKYLTQANLAENEQRVFSTEVYLGTADSEENWKEVDEAYKTQWEQEEERKRLEEEKQRESNLQH